jgi:hypothetical protein
MACFMGYIEVFDAIEFRSKGKWDNDTTVKSAQEQSQALRQTTRMRQDVRQRVAERHDFSDQFKT